MWETRGELLTRLAAVQARLFRGPVTRADVDEMTELERKLWPRKE